MEYIITLIPDCELLNDIFANIQIQSIHIVLCIKNKVFFLIIILNCVIFPRQTQNQTVCWKSFKGNLSIYVIIL